MAYETWRLLLSAVSELHGGGVTYGNTTTTPKINRLEVVSSNPTKGGDEVAGCVHGWKHGSFTPQAVELETTGLVNLPIC